MPTRRQQRAASRVPAQRAVMRAEAAPLPNKATRRHDARPSLHASHPPSRHVAYSPARPPTHSRTHVYVAARECWWCTYVCACALVVPVVRGCECSVWCAGVATCFHCFLGLRYALFLSHAQPPHVRHQPARAPTTRWHGACALVLPVCVHVRIGGRPLCGCARTLRVVWWGRGGGGGVCVCGWWWWWGGGGVGNECFVRPRSPHRLAPPPRACAHAR